MFAEFHRFTPRRIAVLTALLALTALVAHAKGPVGKITQVAAPAPIAAPKLQKPRIDAVFVLDTTGSMSGLIESAKQTIWSLASAMADGQPAPEIRIGLVGYRDRGDDYVTRSFDLTDDIDSVYANLHAFSAGGGGDTPESVNQALHEAVTRMSWSSGQEIYKVVFLVGDAPPHMDYQDDVGYRATSELARKRGIAINTIQCGNAVETAFVWQEIARLGAGQFAAVSQDGGAVAMSTPMDDELMQLNRELAGTVVAYGDRAAMADTASKIRLAARAPANVTAARLKYFAKKDGRVTSGRRDLVDAVKDGLTSVDRVAKAALPTAMRSLDADGRRAYLQQKLEEREAIQARIVELSRKRDDHLRSEHERMAAEGAAEGFDQKVLNAVREQATGAGIRYE